MFNQILSLDLCAFDLRVLGTTDRSLIGFGEAYFVSLKLAGNIQGRSFTLYVSPEI